MEFSDRFKMSPDLCAFSPDGVFVASASQNRLCIRNVASLQIERICTCLDVISAVSWSADSAFVMCPQYKRAIVQVFSLDEPEWNCKIDEGAAGLTAAIWSPNGRNILTTAEFQLRITIWSLVDKSVAYIKYPKYSQAGIAFTHNGSYLAVAERRNGHDFVGVYDTQTWEMVKRFEVDTQDLANVSFSPDDRVLCVWDSSVDFKVSLYGLDGHRLGGLETPYSHALGIKSVSWAPSGRLLAVGSYDQHCRLLNNVTWSVVMELAHTTRVAAPGVVVYEETYDPEEEEQGGENAITSNGLTESARTDCEEVATPACAHYAVRPLPFTVPGEDESRSKKSLLSKSKEAAGAPRIGVGLCVFSSNSRLLATRNDNMSRVVWVWDVSRLALVAVLVHTTPVRSISWQPRSDVTALEPDRLIIATGTTALHMWSPNGCTIVDVPSVPTATDKSKSVAGTVSTVRWHPDGSAFACLDRSSFCIGFFDDQEDTNEHQDNLSSVESSSLLAEHDQMCEIKIAT